MGQNDLAGTNDFRVHEIKDTINPVQFRLKFQSSPIVNLFKKDYGLCC